MDFLCAGPLFLFIGLLLLVVPDTGCFFLCVGLCKELEFAGG